MTDAYFHIIKKDNQIKISGTPVFTAGQTIETRPDNEAKGAFAKWEWDGNSLRVKNCRYGFYPLYYFTRPDEICISNSIPQLLAQRAPTEFDEVALAVFLRLGFFLGEDTPFRAIRAVPPDTTFEWKDGKLNVSGNLYAPKKQELSRDEALDGYIELFRAAIHRRLPTQDFTVPLSGGRDSRHILFELHRAGYNPKFCVTVHQFPYRDDQDVSIAAKLAQVLGIEHAVLNQSQSRVSAEIRKNFLTSFGSDEHSQFLPLVNYFNDRALQIFDGIAGDVLSVGSFTISYKHLMLYESGFFRELAVRILFKFSGYEDDEPELKYLLQPDYFSKFGLELAINRLQEELEKHRNAPNPLSSFYFWNRTRREIALFTFSMYSDPTKILCPYLDYELYDLLAALPTSMFLDHSFHTDTIHRAFPQYKDIPFAQTKNVSSPEHSRRFALELAGYVNSEDGSQFINKERILPPLIRCAVDGKSRHINWMNPIRVLYLLQLENFTNQIVTPGISANLWHGEAVEGEWNDFEKTTSKMLQELGSKVSMPESKEEPFEDQWWHRREKALKEVTNFIPEGTTFIFADDGQFGEYDEWNDLYYKPLPFLEKDGQYWGPPSNDKIAIQEFERLRQQNADFMVFAWTAFNWLDYYPELHQHLLSNFDCVLENSLLIVFDLRR